MDDVGMIDRRVRERLLAKAREPIGVDLEQNLHRDAPSEVELYGLVDRAHAAPSDELEELVALADDLTEQ